MENFNVSTNILRDSDTAINYIPTRNAKDNFNRIISNFNNNNRFQGIIGSYGTGKSTFLWAFEQYLLGKNKYFDSKENQVLVSKSFKFIKLIGEYKPLSVSLANTLKIKILKDEPSDIDELVLSKLESAIKSNTKKNIITVLILDEFGKFLEYAVKNNPDKEVYFIQKLAEFFNDPKKLALSICSLHQNFSSYGQTLNSEQFKEWEKVKGRMKEVPFNEPIDQLLYFASERNYFKDLSLNDDSLKLFNLIKTHNISDKKQILDTELAKKLLPIDYISAEILTKSLQRYGQNERSLFTFLDIDESFSLKRFYNNTQLVGKDITTYNLSEVFDYIHEHYYYVISAKSNTDLTHWNAIKSALDQADTRLSIDYIIPGRKIIKAIGLLNIFSHLGSKIDEEFLINYSKLALGIDNAEDIIKKLTSQKIISYKNYKHRYVFVDWTDIDIESELNKASDKIQRTNNTSERVAQLDGFHPILVKSYYFKTGTPRVFIHKSSSVFSKELPEDSDALINYVFPETDIKPLKVDLPIVYAVFKNTKEINSLFFEIDTAKKVKEENKEDISALKELDERIFYSEQKLKDILIEDVYSNKNVTWHYSGKEKKIKNKSQLNKLLNLVLEEHYQLSPILKSELINKSKLSTPISTARKNLFSQLISNGEKEDIGFGKDKFPPEKTIYLSFIKKIGLHRLNKKTGFYEFGTPDFDQSPLIKSYETLWSISTQFLNDSKKDKKNIKDLYEALTKAPLKLKQGVVDFWVPIFLIAKTEDYALFNANGYIPNIDTEVFDVMYKSPHKFWIKAFDISGVKLEVFNKYKSILNQKKTSKPSEKDFINTIKPFIVFTRSLNTFQLNTTNLKPEVVNLREAIINSKDPEKSFFEDFPKALNYSDAIENGDQLMLKGFVSKMQDSISEIRDSYTALIDRFEDVIKKVLLAENTEFKSYQKLLIERLESIDSTLLNSKLRNIYRKCINNTNDKKIFLEGIAYAVLGKGLDKIADFEEAILNKDFQSNYKKLLSLVDLHKIKNTHKKDAVFGVKIFNESGDDIERKIVVQSKDKGEVKKMFDKINNSFNGIDVNLKKAVLIQLLKEEINE